MVNNLPTDPETNNAKNEGADAENPNAIANGPTPRSHANNAKKYKDAAERYLKITYQWMKITVWERYVKRFIFSSNAWIAVATVVIAVTTGIYTHYARKQWKVMEGQLSLTRDQLKGTQAAFVSVTLGMNEPYSAVIIYVRNNGHVISGRFTGRFTITRETLPERKIVGEPIIKTIGPHPLPVGQDGMIEETYQIPNFGSEGWDSIKRLEQTIFIEWDVSYDDGFEEVIHDHRCMFYLYSNFQVRDGQAVGFAVGFTPCDSFERMFEDAINSRKNAESKTSTQKAPKKPN
jgi:hypothetical protein